MRLFAGSPTNELCSNRSTKDYQSLGRDCIALHLMPSFSVCHRSTLMSILSHRTFEMLVKFKNTELGIL